MEIENIFLTRVLNCDIINQFSVFGGAFFSLNNGE